MKLYLDDVRKCPKGWVPVRNALDAIQLLKEHSVEEMSFDHDLGEDALSGYDVLTWIEEKVFEGKFNPPKIWIHTVNPAGHKKMVAAKKQIERMMRERIVQEIVDSMHLKGVGIQVVRDLKGLVEK